MYGYRKSSYKNRQQSSVQHHFTQLQQTASRLGLNPFRSAKQHLPNGKPASTFEFANGKQSSSSQTTVRKVATLAIAALTVLVLLRSFFSSSTTANNIASKAASATSIASLDTVIALDRDERYQKLDLLVEDECLSTLSFHLDESATDSILTQFRTWLWHYSWDIPMSVPANSPSFVITKHGTVLSSADSSIAALTQDTDYASCDLISAMFTKLHNKALITLESESEQSSNTEDHSHSFTSYRNQNHDDIWAEQGYGSLFSLDNENRDAWTLIEQALSLSERDVDKHKQLQIMSYKLLHSYCGNVFDHLSTNNADSSDFKSHETLVSEVTRHLYSIKYADYGMSHKEVILVDSDGTLNIGHNAVELEGEYDTCPLIQKLITYQYSENGLKEQLEDVMNAVQDQTFHREHLAVFDSKMDVLLEQHCAETVRQLQVSGVYHSVFRDNLYQLANELGSNSAVSANDQYFVDVDSGDLVLHKQSRKNLQCKVIDGLVQGFGDKKQGYHGHDYEMSKFREQRLSGLNSKNEYAKVILDTANANDLAGLRHVLSETIRTFYAPQIKKQMTVSYKSSGDEFETRIETLAVSMEQFVVDLLVRNKKPVEKNVVMDVVSGIVVAVSDGRMKTLTSNWIEVDVLEELRAIKDQKVTTKQNTVQTKTTTKTETSAASESSDVAAFVETLMHDVKKVNDVAQVMSEFDEDIVFGLNNYCGSAMQSMSSFAKRQLRKNVGSLLAGKTDKVKGSVVVTDQGAIQSFESAGQQQVFKCDFVTSLMKRV